MSDREGMEARLPDRDGSLGREGIGSSIRIRPESPADGFPISAIGIVPLYFSAVSWGDARASSESTIHRQILLNPGVRCVVHAHYISMTSTSFDTKEKEIFRVYQGKDEKKCEEFVLVPVDMYGANCIGSVKIASYIAPAGSAEMEERISRYLKKDKMTIVKGHGPFARGASIEEVVQNLSILENSATLLVYLRRRGIDTGKIQKALLEGSPDAVFPAALSIPDDYENNSNLQKHQPDHLYDHHESHGHSRRHDLPP